jgi:secreted trypsin-like serine protease
MRIKLIFVVFILIFIDFSQTNGSCGDRSGFRATIYGGDEAQKGLWPWITAFTYKGKYFCGGSLISNQHVLSGK